MTNEEKMILMGVIKAHMDGEDKNTKAVLSDIMESVNELETLEQEPICDRDCEHCTWTECPIEPCDDAISRKDAEQMFRNIRSHLKPQDYKSAEEFNTRDLMLLNAEQMIHALPSVTQKSKTGHWIRITNGAMKEKYICSECGRQIENDGIEGLLPIKYPYCHCGAKMESEDKK